MFKAVWSRFCLAYFEFRNVYINVFLQGKPGFPGLPGQKGNEGSAGRDGQPGLDGFQGPQVGEGLHIWHNSGNTSRW